MGEWLLEKPGTKTRRSWRKLHFGMNAETGVIVAAELMTNDVDDASQVGPLLGQVAGPIASLTGDGAYDQDGVYRSVADHQPATAVIVPPRAAAEHEDDSVLVSHKADGPQRDREILPAT